MQNETIRMINEMEDVILYQYRNTSSKKAKKMCKDLLVNLYDLQGLEYPDAVASEIIKLECNERSE